MVTANRFTRSNPAIAHSRGRSWRAWLSLALLGAVTGLGAATGCSGDETCQGVEVDGKCVAQCSDSGCLENNRCLDNACIAQCGIQDDCAIGTNCVQVSYPDDGGDSKSYCVALSYTENGRTGQDGEACGDDAECDTRRGFHCVAVDGSPECRQAGCSTSEDCKAGLCREGGGLKDGSTVSYCDPSATGEGPCTSDAECDNLGGAGCIESDGAKQCAPMGCTTHAECGEGSHCRIDGATTSGMSVSFCVSGDFTPRGDSCSKNTECDNLYGFTCIEGSCALADCRVHGDCQEFGLCQFGGTDSEGATRNYCVPGGDGEQRGEGQFGSSCVEGAEDCAEDFVCLGAGEGDLESYCTQFDCTADDDCGTGYYCTRVRTGGTPCTDSCANIAGESGLDCIPDADIGAGKKYECGVLNLRRNVCRKADFCSPCETHQDCLAQEGQVCARDSSGVKHCSEPCDLGTGSCPWGNAATCAVWDQDLGIATCSHRFGSCAGTGVACEPCVTSDDCGDTGICSGNNNTGERYCIDLTTECSCDGFTELTGARAGACRGGTCPLSPGGLSQYCYAFLDDPSNLINNRCLPPDVSPGPFSSPQVACWPAQ